MADFIVSKDGSITVNKKKKKKAANFIVSDDGSILPNPKKSVDIAPVRKLSEKEKKRTWFSSGAFSDGYDVGDVTKTILGTTQDITENAFSGAIGIAEKTIDTGAYIIGGVGGAFGNNKLQSNMEKFIKKDLIDEEKIGRYASYAMPTGLINRFVVGDKADEYSVLGEKSDSLVQSAGQLGATFGLQAVGVPWWLTTGTTSFGGEAEQALNQGATYGEAGFSGLVSAGAEILTEKLSGGISFGGKTLDKGLKNSLTKGITNKTYKTLAKFGIDAVGEGLEEVATEVISSVGRKLSYEDEKTWGELLASEQAMENYLEAFIGGAVMGGGFNIARLNKSLKTGRDYDSGLTQNEQRVLDNETKQRTTEIQKQRAVEDRINNIIEERERTFGALNATEKQNIKNSVMQQLDEGQLDYSKSELSKKEIAKIEQEVREDLEKGNLNIESIENTLLGEKKAQIRELEQELSNTKGDAEKAQIQARINELQGANAAELQNLLRNDVLLQNSYREANLKKEQFTAKEGETISEKVSGVEILNNTTRSHELVQNVSKIADDKGTNYGFINNEQLKELGYDIEGKDVNGLVRVNEDGTQKVLINIDSEKAINRIVGHETTHLLEGTKEYTELQEMVKQYATTKGEYDTRLKALSKLYEGTNANVENEVTADLVGDYLFTDTDFINNLSVQKPNIFQKIFNEIKHLYKLATAGSTEARQLERVKKAFEDAYRANVSNSIETDTKYSISENAKFSEERLDRVIRESVSKWDGDYAKDYVVKMSPQQFLDLTTYPELLDRLKSESTKLDVEQLRKESQHIFLEVDMQTGKVTGHEGRHRMLAMLDAGIQEVDVVIYPDRGTYETYNAQDYSVFNLKGQDLGEYKGKDTTVNNLTAVTYNNVDKIKQEYLSNTNDADVKYSLSDNQGRELTKEQQERFKDSKVRDEKGNLLTVYHGTRADFNVFDMNKAGQNYEGDWSAFGRGFYFTPNQEAASDFSSAAIEGNNKNVKEVYLNITNPFYTETNYSETLSNLKEKYNIDDTTLNKGYRLIEFLNQNGYDSTKVLQELGYDGVIDSYNGKIEEAVAFEPNQIKNITNENPTENPDIRYSLSVDDYGMSHRPSTDYGDASNFEENMPDVFEHPEWYFYGSDARSKKAYMESFNALKKVRNNPEGEITIYRATIGDTINEGDWITPSKTYAEWHNDSQFDGKANILELKVKAKDIRFAGDDLNEFGYFPNGVTEYSLSNFEHQQLPSKSRNDIFGSDIKLQVEEAIAPIQEAVAELTEQIQEIAPVKQTTEDYSPVTEADLPMMEQQWSEDFKNIDESNIPMEVEDTTPEYEDTITETKDLFETRDYEEVGNRKIKAYQYENPEVKPYFQEAARSMLGDLKESIKGERYIIGDISQMGDGNYEFSGNKRYTTEDIADLLDGIDGKYKLSYAEIEKGLEAIIKDEGAENNAASKRIEFYLDQRLRNGYTTIDGYDIPANQEYLETIRGIERDNYYRSIPFNDSMIPAEYKPIRNVSNSESIAPSGEMSVNQDGQGRLDLGLNRLNAPEGEPLNRDVEAIDLENARQLTIDGTEEDLVTKTRKELRKALLGTEARKEFIVNALDNAKNRSMAFMNNTDTIRNTELVFGRDAGNVINEIIFQPEIDNEARSIAWQNKQRQEIKELGIKARSKESAAVQKYGEKQYVNEAGEVIAYGDAELASEFKDVATQEKIKNAAKVIRNKYDAYIDQANNVLTKLGFEPIKKRNDYMRHFQELNDVFSRYGIPFNAQSMTEHTLPTDINGLTEFWSPQKNYFANMQQRKGIKTTYDAITGVDGYISGISNLIFHTEDIQRGRAFEDLIRETYGEEKGWENLESLPEELQQARAEKIQDNHLSNYAAWVHEWTNNVAGKKNKLDRSVEAVFGRKAFSFLDGARKQVGANMIGFNLSSSLTNLIAPVQAMAKTKKLAVLKGTGDTIKNIFIKDNFMEKNSFLTSRMGTDMLSQNTWQKIQNAGYVFMKGMDWFSSNQIVRSKYYELRAKGMSETEAHAEAGKFAARILGDRTKGANAQLYNSKLVGLVTQFQLEVNNQLYSMFYDTYHESKENARNNAARTAAGMTFTLGQLFAFTHLFGKTFEAIAGYNPTLDVIGILATALGLGDDEDDEKTTSERLKAAADQLVDALPYVNILTGGGRIPIASGLPNLVGVATGGKDEYGNELTLSDELKKLLFLLPPTGGNQVKKTTQGLGMFDDDLPVSGSYTDSGNLRFPVEETPLNVLQAALFGQWANKNAGEYFDKERQPLKSKQIQEYADLDLPIADYWKYRDGLKEQKTIQEKFDYINGLDVTDEQKNIMINNAVERKEDIDLSNYDDFGSYEEFDYATKNPEKYSVISQIDSFDKYNSYKEDIASIKEQFSNDNGYDTKQRKAAVQQYIQSLSLSVPQKIMLEKMAGGYSVKSYISYMQQYIESLPLTAEEKQIIHNQLFD